LVDINESSHEGCSPFTCEKSKKEEFNRIIEVIKAQYYMCANIENDVCYTWWKHEECESLRALLFTLTDDDRYKEPLTKLRGNASAAVEKIINDPWNKEIMERLKRMEDNGI